MEGKRLCDLKGYEMVQPYYRITEGGNILGYGGNVMKQQIDRVGYMWVNARTGDGNTRRVLVHRVIALAYLPHSDKLEVNHIDHNKANNALYNLEWATRAENMQHNWREDYFENTAVAMTEFKIACSKRGWEFEDFVAIPVWVQFTNRRRKYYKYKRK